LKKGQEKIVLGVLATEGEQLEGAWGVWQWLSGSDFYTVGKRRTRRLEWYQFDSGSGSIDGDMMGF
jgi:hypothetical protein